MLTLHKKTPRSQSSEEVTNSDTEQLSVDQRISIKESENPDGIDIMDSEVFSTLIDKSGNVLQNEDQTAIGGHPDDADKPASGPIIEDRATRARQENKPLQYNVKKPDNDMTTEVTDEIPDIEKLPYGVQPNPDEERVLANMQLDIGVADKKKKKNKKRPKTKRGMVCSTNYFILEYPAKKSIGCAHWIRALLC
jgi:hypothetical protein